MAPTALITGAGKRIGRELALHLARNGWDIAAHYHLSQADAHDLAGRIRALDRECTLFQADLSSPGDADNLIGSVMERCGRLDLLINNASIFHKGSITDTDYHTLERHFMINCFAPILLARDFARHAGAGQIINILDTKITRSNAGYCAYTLSKKALSEFTGMAAQEFAPHIRVNAVAPGIILPPPGEDASYLDPLIKRVPLQRKGDPGDICRAVDVFITNDYITGQVLFIDGGDHMR